MPRRAPAKNQSPRQGSEVMTDGSLLITAAQLARFGNGDATEGRKQLRLMLENESDRPEHQPTEIVCPKTIRMAGPDDEPAILDLLLQDLRENAEHIAPVDEARVMETIRAGTRQRGGLVAVIDGPDKKPVAVTILHPVAWWWSNGFHWFEIVNFVHVDHRRSHHADDLLKFQRWASDSMSKKMGAQFYLVCGVLGAWRVRAKIALYRRYFQQAGAAFVFPTPPARGN